MTFNRKRLPAHLPHRRGGIIWCIPFSIEVILRAIRHSLISLEPTLSVCVRYDFMKYTFRIRFLRNFYCNRLLPYLNIVPVTSNEVKSLKIFTSFCIQHLHYNLSEATPTTCAVCVSIALNRNLRRLPSPSTLPVTMISAPANLPIETAVSSSTSPLN